MFDKITVLTVFWSYKCSFGERMSRLSKTFKKILPFFWVCVFSDGREWSCNLHEEIEASCSKLLYKEKTNVLQLVMHKKIPLNTWPTFAVGTPAHSFPLSFLYLSISFSNVLFLMKCFIR